jgi:hypothetical protein
MITGVGPGAKVAVQDLALIMHGSPQTASVVS